MFSEVSVERVNLCCIKRLSSAHVRQVLHRGNGRTNRSKNIEKQNIDNLLKGYGKTGVTHTTYMLKGNFLMHREFTELLERRSLERVK